MSKINIPFGAVVKCDQTTCAERFTTYSITSLARRQATSAGWSRMLGRHVRDAEGYALGMGGGQGRPLPDVRPRSEGGTRGGEEEADRRARSEEGGASGEGGEPEEEARRAGERRARGRAVTDVDVGRIPSIKPYRPDEIRVERGDYVRAGGDVRCEVCGCTYYEHAGVQGFMWLRRACDGRLLKL